MTMKTVHVRMMEPIGMAARIGTTDSPQRATTHMRMISDDEAVAMLQRSIDKIRTTDPAPASRWLSWRGRGRFRDDNTLITPITTPKNPDMFGRSPSPWDGYSKIKEQLDAMSVTDRAKALRRIADDYGNSPGTGLSPGSMRPGNAGSLTTGADERPEQEFNVGTTATPDDINAANAAAVKDGVWKPRATLDVTPRNAEQAQLQSINSDNAAFWAKQKQGKG
jgi:hypothetical protein